MFGVIKHSALCFAITCLLGAQQPQQDQISRGEPDGDEDAEEEDAEEEGAEGEEEFEEDEDFEDDDE